ncbi:MAG: hypothetical protein HRT88_11290, partial [Lentisphaeraceae bacterium]|nr:hypothetical protein [Lentisphaeraceae bacterium]
SAYKPEITLIIPGPRKSINTHERKDIHVTVSITEEKKPGITELRITPANIKLPPDLVIESITTKAINVDIDVIEEKEVDVRLRYDNRLSERYTLLRDPYPKPNRALIQGPSRQISKIRYLDTRTVDIPPSQTSDFRKTTRIIMPPGIKMNYDTVMAIIELKKRLDYKSLPNQQVYVLNSSEQKLPMNNVAGKAFAYISGPPAALEKLNTNIDVKLFIEVKNNTSGEFPIRFWCSDPSIKKINITPPSIKFSPAGEK